MYKKSRNPHKSDKPVNENGKAVENEVYPTAIPNSTDDVKRKLSEVFSECSDFVIRECILKKGKKDLTVLIVFIDELIDIKILNRDVIKPVSGLLIEEEDNALKIIKKSIDNSNIKEIFDFEAVVNEILAGSAIVFVDGETTAFTSTIRNTEGRGIKEPKTDMTIHGPRDSFVERIRTNK